MDEQRRPKEGDGGPIRLREREKGSNSLVSSYESSTLWIAVVEHLSEEVPGSSPDDLERERERFERDADEGKEGQERKEGGEGSA